MSTVMEESTPSFAKYFVPYGTNLQPTIFSRGSEPTQSHSSSLSQRSLSLSSSKTEHLRKTQKASIIELFGRKYSFDGTISSPYGMAPLGRGNTPFQFLEEIRNRVRDVDRRPAKSWPDMPPYQTPLHLPTPILKDLFTPDFSYEECNNLWSAYSMLSDSASESWVAKVVYKGEIISSESASFSALTSAYSDYPIVFIDLYTKIVRKSGIRFLEKFVDDIDLENWDPMSSQTINENPVAKYLLTETQLNATDFAQYMFSHLRWDAMWINRKYPSCSITLPLPGEDFPNHLQQKARELLLRIGNFRADADFDVVTHHLLPSLEFLLGPANYKMMVRVYHTVGPERFCVALSRKGTKLQDQDDKAGLAPLHLISFSATFLLNDLHNLAYSRDMLGARVYNHLHQAHFADEETKFFSSCKESVDNLWDSENTRPAIEAMLRKVMDGIDKDHVLDCNIRNVELLKAEGHICTYSYNPPVVARAPVFAAPPAPPPVPVFTPPHVQMTAIQTTPHPTLQLSDLDDAGEFSDDEDDGGDDGDEGDARIH